MKGKPIELADKVVFQRNGCAYVGLVVGKRQMELGSPVLTLKVKNEDECRNILERFVRWIGHDNRYDKQIHTILSEKDKELKLRTRDRLKKLNLLKYSIQDIEKNIVKTNDRLVQLRLKLESNIKEQQILMSEKQ